MAIRHSSDYRTLASLSRINLLHELQHNGSQTISQLAKATRLHHNTTREHLHRLIDAGFVDSESIPSAGKGRPQLRYRAARGSESPALQSRRASSERRTGLVRKLHPVTDASAENAPLSRQLDALDDHIEQCGFDADIETDQSRVVIHNCPYSALAKDNPQVCEVHFALIQDALDNSEGPIRASELHPFSGPRTCTIHLQS